MPRRRVSDALRASCWCELVVLNVPRSEILACRTASCGAPNCRPLVEV